MHMIRHSADCQELLPFVFRDSGDVFGVGESENRCSDTIDIIIDEMIPFSGHFTDSVYIRRAIQFGDLNSIFCME